MRRQRSALCASLCLIFTATCLLSGCRMLFPHKSRDASYLKGSVAFRKKQFDEADKLLTQVKSDNPNYQHALSLRGEIADINGDIDGALALLKQAEAVDPTKFRKGTNSAYSSAYNQHMTKHLLDYPGGAKILFGAGDGAVIVWSGRAISAFDYLKNRPLWSEKVSKEVPPFYTGQSVVAYRDKQLIALDPNTGREIWAVPFGSRSDVYYRELSMGTDGKSLFVGVRLEPRTPVTVRALNPKTGQERWQREVDGDVGPIAASAGRIYFRTDSGSLTCLDAQTGTPRWSVGFGPKYKSDQLLATPERVYLVASDGRAYAFDASDKVYERPLERILWQSDPTHAMVAKPALIGTTLIVPRHERILGLDANTGAQLWLTKLTCPSKSTPYRGVVAQARGDIAVVAYAKSMVGIDDKGTLRWVYNSLHGRSETFKVHANAVPILTEDLVLVAGAIPQGVRKLLVGLNLRPEQTW